MKTNDKKLAAALIFLAILGILVVACKDEVLVPVNDTKKADSLIAVITKLDQQIVTINAKENTITIENALLNTKIDSLNNAFGSNPRKIQYTVYLINAGNTITTTNGERTKGVDGATVTLFAGGKTATTTSSDGRAIFEGLDGGNATVQILATGYSPVTFQTYFFNDNRSSFGDGAVRTASTNILIFPNSGKDAVAITGQLYANKSTIDDTLGRQYNDAGDAAKYLKYVSNPGISDFTNFTQATNHSWSTYLYYHANSQYDSIPDGTTVKYDKITSLKGANIYGYPNNISSTSFNDFDATIPGEILDITYTGLASVATVDNTGRYTLNVASYANYPGVNMQVEHYTDSHNFLTLKSNLGSTPITLTSFNVTLSPYVTTKKIFYQITSNWIYRASITQDNGTAADVPFYDDYYEFLGYSGYNITSVSFEGKPGTTINRNIFFYATVPAP